jgi:signal transduction histidine kinase
MRLAAGLLSLMLLVVALAGLALHESHLQYEDRARVATRNVSELVGQDIAAVFDKADLALLAIRDEVERQLATNGIDGKGLYLHIAAQHARQPALAALRITDASGAIVHGSGTNIHLPASIGNSSFFARLRDDPDAELLFSKPVVGPAGGMPTIALGRRIVNPDGSFFGLVYATIPLDYFRQRFAGLNLGPNGAVNLRDTQLATVVRHPEPPSGETATGNRTVSTEWQEALKRNPVAGTYFATGLDQHARVLSYHKVGIYPFYIIVGLLPKDFLLEWRQEVMRTLMLVAVFLVVTTSFLFLMRRAWKRHEADAKRMAELSRRLIAMQESERRRLALELHDVVSPNLAALKMNLSTMLTELPPQTVRHFGSRLSDVQALLDDTAISLREICANLRPAMLDYSGLLPALKDYAAQFSRGATVDVKVTGDAPEQRLAPDVESVLFRIAQEAVTNGVKHAQANSIVIELAQHAGRTRLTIIDDGLGFEQALLGRRGSPPGLGLITMRERAEFAGGQFHIESAKWQGTRITVEIPSMA